MTMTKQITPESIPPRRAGALVAAITGVALLVGVAMWRSYSISADEITRGTPKLCPARIIALSGRICVRVVDSETKQAISGATIQWQSSTSDLATATTDTTGIGIINNIDITRSTINEGMLSIDADGYIAQSISLSIDPRDNTSELTVSLEK
jgi:hypothetical protein